MAAEKEIKKISAFQKQLNEFWKLVPIEHKKGIEDAHSNIISYTQGYTSRYFYNLGLLHKLLHFRKTYNILFADQIEVVKRNIGKRDRLTDTEILRIFDPEKLFIEQCNIIAQKRKNTLKNKKKTYDGILTPISKKNQSKELF
jgi:hypothetical protein